MPAKRTESQRVPTLWLYLLRSARRAARGPIGSLTVCSAATASARRRCALCARVCASLEQEQSPSTVRVSNHAALAGFLIIGPANPISVRGMLAPSRPARATCRFPSIRRSASSALTLLFACSSRKQHLRVRTDPARGLFINRRRRSQARTSPRRLDKIYPRSYRPSLNRVQWGR